MFWARDGGGRGIGKANMIEKRTERGDDLGLEMGEEE